MKKTKQNKPLLIIKVTIRGEVYDRVYSIADIKNVIEFFNDIHRSGMKLVIEEVKEVKP